MENKEISKIFKATSALMEVNGENDFKARSYSIAAYKIDQLTERLADMTAGEIEGLEGIGKSMAAKIRETVDTGTFAALEELLEKTPEGVQDMMSLKGIGPKKIRTIWEELGVESVEELEQACRKDKVAGLKGFGAKTQQTILDAIAYRKEHEGFLLYAEAEALATSLLDSLKERFRVSLEITGQVRRCAEVTNEIMLLAGTEDTAEITEFISSLDNLTYLPGMSGPYTWRGFVNDPFIRVEVRFCTEEAFATQLLLTSASAAHLNHEKEGVSLIRQAKKQYFPNETAIYQSVNLPFIAPELREGLFEHKLAEEGMPPLIETSDIKGILHCHSTYSDGAHTLREMAVHCKEQGFQYLGITDHSKTATYASGLREAEVKKQHAEIDELNRELAPFRIFKGIESDILGDGSLDYNADVLDSFDFIIGSVHANIKMEKAQATERIIKAIQNPYTTMIGHLTARILLQRPGFPVDFDAILEACLAHNVILELNAHPSRLDLDWRWLGVALQKGMLTSVNPDAHRKEGYGDIYYGVQAGRKAGLQASQCLNTFSLEEIEKYFAQRKEKALASV